MRISDWSSDVCSSDLQYSSTYGYRHARGQPIIRRDDGAFLTSDPDGIPDEIRAWIEARVRQRGPVPLTDRMFRHGRNYQECALRGLELRGDEETCLFPPARVRTGGASCGVQVCPTV